MAKFKVRDITDDDMPEIARWFSTRKWPQPIVEGIAPSYGLIAETEEGLPISCVWVYTTGRSIAFMEWLGSNPDAPGSLTILAMKSLTDHLKQMCELSDPPIRALRFYTQNKALAAQLESRHFKKSKDYLRLIWTNPVK